MTQFRTITEHEILTLAGHELFRKIEAETKYLANHNLLARDRLDRWIVQLNEINDRLREIEQQ
jgi:hypothetical protein